MGALMSKIFLNNQVLVYLFVESIALILLSLGAFFSGILIKKWDFNSFAQYQFKLENRAFLISTFATFILLLLIAELIYFVFVIDSLSILIPGAMCGAGVISANSYGLVLLFVKLTLIFLLLLWYFVNSYDLQESNYPLIKHKSWLFLVIFGLFLFEYFLDFAYFTNIDISQPVSCCSALFGQLEGSNPLPFGLDMASMLILFYLLFFAFLSALFTKQNSIALILIVAFLFIGYYSVVYFFGTYVYELPTHKCPFCMMQKEYYYVGYFIWGSLFLGGFLAIIYLILNIWLKSSLKKAKKASVYLLLFFVVLNSCYVLIYYFRNGVFL